MIRLYHVSKTFDGKTYPLVDINLHVRKGEFAFLSGPSGAGKTTLLRLLYADEKSSQGQILVNARNINRIHGRQLALLRRKMGIVFQDYKLLLDRTVYENIDFVLQVLEVPKTRRGRKIIELLNLVGLNHKSHSRPAELSGGEQQRVAIARAMAYDPLIVLADEPTGNLDHAMSLEVMGIFSNIHKRGATVVIATHNDDLVARFPARVIRIDRGRTGNQADDSTPEGAKTE